MPSWVIHKQLLYNYYPFESFLQLVILVSIVLNTLDDDDLYVGTGILCGGIMIVFALSRNIVICKSLLFHITDTIKVRFICIYYIKKQYCFLNRFLLMSPCESNRMN